MLSDIRWISAVLEDWVRAVCRGDREAVAALWAAPGLVVDHAGASAIGSDAASALQIMLLCGRACPGCAEMMQIERFQMVAPGVASVTIAPQPDHQVPDGCPLGTTTFVVGREGEAWRLRLMVLGPPD